MSELNKTDESSGLTSASDMSETNSPIANMPATNASGTHIVPDSLLGKMNELNSKACKVLNAEGDKAFIKHVFTDQKSGKKLTYGEMRERYG